MNTLPILPLAVRKSAAAMAQARESVQAARTLLDKAALELQAALGNSKALTRIKHRLAQAHADLERHSDAQAARTRKCVRSHFAKLGIAEGALIELNHPVLKVSLDESLIARREDHGSQTTRLRVEGFYLVKAPHASLVTLDIVGRAQRNNRGPYNQPVQLRLEASRAFKVIKPAP